MKKRKKKAYLSLSDKQVIFRKCIKLSVVISPCHITYTYYMQHDKYDF